MGKVNVEIHGVYGSHRTVIPLCRRVPFDTRLAKLAYSENPQVERSAWREKSEVSPPCLDDLRSRTPGPGTCLPLLNLFSFAMSYSPKWLLCDIYEVHRILPTPQRSNFRYRESLFYAAFLLSSPLQNNLRTTSLHGAVRRPLNVI